MLVVGGCERDLARIDGVLLASADDSTSLEGVQVRLVAMSDSVQNAVGAACERYVTADSAVTEARFAGGIARSAGNLARTVQRFRRLDDSATALERTLLATLDSIYREHAIDVVPADSIGTFRLTRIPPGRYALVAARPQTRVAEIWSQEIALAPRARRRVDVGRPADGHLTCFQSRRRR